MDARARVHARAHTDQLLCRDTLPYAHSLDHFNAAAELQTHTHLPMLTKTRTQGLRLKEKLGGIITAAQTLGFWP